MKILLETNEVVNAKEAARLLGISYPTLYRWIKRGLIIPIHIQGRTLIPQSEISRLKGGQHGGNTV